MKKPPVAFCARERRLLAKLRTPLMVQRYLNQLPYNNEPGGRATLRSFRGVVRHGWGAAGLAGAGLASKFVWQIFKKG